MPEEREGQANIAEEAASAEGPVYPATDQWDPSQRKQVEHFWNLPWTTFFDNIPQSSSNFLYGVYGKKPLSYNVLREFMLDARNDIPGLERESRLCSALPDGPDHCVAFLVFTVRYTFAPLALYLKADEFDFKFQDMPAAGLVLQKKDGLTEEEQAATGVAIASARRQKLQIIMEMTPDPEICGLFSLAKHAAGKPLKGAAPKPWRETASRDHVCLALHTSGTTKKPKIVPLTHGYLGCDVLVQASNNVMTKDDVFLSYMPMFHLGALAENILMTLMAGGKLICCPGIFQVGSFHTQLLRADPKPTCYSAVPTHHIALMQWAREMEKSGTPFSHSLKFIRNDAAALLPSVAVEMEEYIKATVMPCYSMTEANPMCSNPRFGMRKLKSVGFVAGPDIQLMEGWPSANTVPDGECGEVCIRGETTMKGYEMRPHMEVDPNAELFTDGWLRSGDKAYFDKDGYLYLVGRFKELINRAGEKISPFKVEEVVRKHDAIADCTIFATPHSLLGEAIGMIAVLKPGKTLTRASLQDWILEKNLLDKKWIPEMFIRMPSLPQGGTGKPFRVNLHVKLKLPVLSGKPVEMDLPEYKEK